MARAGVRVLRRQREEVYIDYSMIFIILFLLAFGLVMIYSTSTYWANLKVGGDSSYYFRHQFGAVLGGIAAMMFMSYFPYGLLRKLSFPLYATSVVLLLITPIVGIKLNGAKRWIKIPGVGLTIQPAEIAKIAVIVFMASIILRLQKLLLTPKGYGVAVGFPAFLALLIRACTKNLSSAIIVMAIAIVMLFVATPGYKRYVMAALSVLGFAIVLVLIIVNAGKGGGGFRSERVLAWLDPQAHASGKGFQTLQALYAIGSGGTFGKGLGESMQKMGFIPEAQNDMIFSIICEELGLFGAIAVMLMFLLLIWRLMIIANNAPDMFGALLVIGVMAHIAIQVVLNIAVVTNTIPNTGITLPFISYGGSAVIIQLAELGVALNVGRNIGR